MSKVVTLHRHRNNPKAVLQRILEKEHINKFVIVYIKDGGDAVFEQCSFGQRDMAWASVILGKHAVELYEDEE